jgi:hypothetical protein
MYLPVCITLLQNCQHLFYNIIRFYLKYYENSGFDVQLPHWQVVRQSGTRPPALISFLELTPQAQPFGLYRFLILRNGQGVSDSDSNHHLVCQRIE